MKNCFPDIVSATYLPRIVRFTDNYYALIFPLMKLLPAMRIIENGIGAGLINKTTHIIESSSGTFAKGLAMVCNLKRLRLTIVSDNAIDENFKSQLEDLGAVVEIVEQWGERGIQFARLERLEILKKRYPNHYWPCQYDNPWNREAYSEIGETILNNIGCPDYLTGSVGSGGSMCGTTTFLRKTEVTIKAIGIDTHNSVLFGQKDGKRVLRGLGNSLMPANLIHQIFDEVHWVTAKEAFLATRILHREYSVFAGPTSGATFMVGRYIAENNKGKLVVSIFADEGWRYGKLFDDRHLQNNNVFLKVLPDKPVQVYHPHEANPERWAKIEWNRQSLEEVLNRKKY